VLVLINPTCPSRGITENKHSTDADSHLPRMRVCMLSTHTDCESCFTFWSITCSECPSVLVVYNVFRNLLFVRGELIIADNLYLAVLSESFNFLDSIGLKLSIVNNPSLVKITKSFVSLRAVGALGGNLEIAGNVALTLVEKGSLNGLIQVGGTLQISSSR
jgi:hypothetical protein